MSKKVEDSTLVKAITISEILKVPALNLLDARNRGERAAPLSL